MANRYSKTLSINLISIFIILFCLFSPSRTNASSLSLLPTPTEVSVGDSISLKIFVNTEGKYVNNAEATIQFPIDILEVTSVKRSSSVFSLWVEEPTFSNITGKITFNGGVPSPGFNGSSGYISTITLRAKKKGTASLIFLDGAVRENDGLGTNILTEKKGSTIYISTKKEVKEPDKTEISKPIIIESFKPAIRFIGNQGIIELGDDNTIPNVDHYSLLIDSESNIIVKDDQLLDGEYYLPILNEGVHSIEIMSFDKNSKYTESKLSFMSPPVSVPSLSLENYVITKGNSAIVLGKTDYPRTEVSVILEKEGKEIRRYTQQTRQDGSFSVTTDIINETGLVSIWAENSVSDEVISKPSEKIYLRVNEMEVVRVTLAIFYPALFIIVAIIILLLLFMLLYLIWRKIFSIKNNLK